MNKQRTAALITAILVLISTGCRSAGKVVEVAAVFDERARQTCPALYAQISNKPEADARRSFELGNNRYINTYSQGYGVIGLPEAAIDDAIRRGPKAYRVLEGWDDYIGPETCMNFTNDAPEYAYRYNQQMWKQLQRR